MADVSRVILGVVSLATLVVLAGCGSDDGTHAAGASAGPSATHAPTQDLRASRAPAPAETPSTRPTAHPSRHGGRHKVGTLAPRSRADADAHLLDADRIPRIDGRTWSAVSSDSDDPVGRCQKTALDSIGAVDTAARAFTAEDGLAATQVVARFADAKSAWRAHRVLVAWRDDCEGRVAHATVGPLKTVHVHAGSADSYRGSFGRHGRAATLGILRTGAYLTLVEVGAAADDYPTDWDPARRAVRRVSRTF